MTKKSAARSVDTKGQSTKRTGSREVLETGSRAASAARRSRSTKKVKSSSTNHVDDLIAATAPLLDLFSVCDSVFTEEDAFQPEHIMQTLGRVYESWKRTRRYFDPDFHVEDYLRPRRARRRGLNPERL